LTTIAALIDRVALYVQDQTHEAWPVAQKEAQLRDEFARLGRQEIFGAALWQQVLAGEAEYLFPEEVVQFQEVLYDQRSLRMVSEDALTRLQRDWDQRPGAPQHYTVPLEPSQTVRLIPVPQQTGAATPPSPTVPLATAAVGNLVTFAWVNLQQSATAFDLPAMVEDYMVFQTVGALSGQWGEYHEMARSEAFKTLASLILKELLGGAG
jgi:hypothetical protein